MTGGFSPLSDVLHVTRLSIDGCCRSAPPACRGITNRLRPQMNSPACMDEKGRRVMRSACVEEGLLASARADRERRLVAHGRGSERGKGESAEEKQTVHALYYSRSPSVQRSASRSLNSG